jgi:predicted hydrocarbon binding protein
MMENVIQIQTDTRVVEDRPMPNAALRLLFLSIEEVMGRGGTRAVLNGAKMQQYLDNYPPNNLEFGIKFSDYGRAEQAVEDFYGPRGARAILTRIGRGTFQYGMKEQSAVLGLAGQALKNMPFVSQQAKMKLLLQQMVGAANTTVNQPAHLEEDAESFVVVAERCMCEYRPHHQLPCCFVTVGAFSEAMKWLTDKQFEVKEIACRNLGADACRYRIRKQPVE